MSLGEISVITHTRNNARHLQKLDDSTRWIKCRIAVDMQSNDGTVQLLQESGWEIIEIPPQIWRDDIRNDFLSIPKTEWTLALDSDEYLADDAEANIKEILAQANQEVIGFQIPRFNRFIGRSLEGSGWYPDYQLRLFRTNTVQYFKRYHRHPISKVEGGKIIRLNSTNQLHIHHDNYPSLEEFMDRQHTYKINDYYSKDPLEFDFDRYQIDAIRAFNDRYQTGKERDLAYALALVMYWDQLMRGLIHWEQTGYQGELSHHIPNQVFFETQSQQEKTSRIGFHRLLKKIPKKLR